MTTKPERFSDTTLKLLTKAGWFSGRNVTDSLVLPDGFNIFPAALRILQEFAYLRVGERGPGITCARSTVIFDPMLAQGEEEQFEYYRTIAKCSLYPLGETDDGHGFLAVDVTGRTFIAAGNLWLKGMNFDQALDNLLIGVKGEIVQL